MKRRCGDKYSTYISTSDLPKLIEFGYCWCPKYHKNVDRFYAHTSIYLGKCNDGSGKFKNKNIMLHKFLLDVPSDVFVDHIDYDTLNNVRSNLRIASNKDNLTHRRGKNKNNTSGYRNVRCTKHGTFEVILQIDGKAKRFGTYKDVHVAGRIAEEMRQQHYGEYAGRS